jgi:hypothetical protein
LRKAKELRAQAETAEHQVHFESAQKKAHKDAQTDQLIVQLFAADSLLDGLRAKRLSMDTMEKIVDRLDEREVLALGQDHVEAKIQGDRADYERVATQERDEAELERLEGMIDDLIAVVQILDEEFMEAKQKKNEPYVTHTEEQHWGGGKLAQRLENRIHEIRREREDQFQKRMEEFREAQRIKKDRPPPPKVKDDHGFFP